VKFAAKLQSNQSRVATIETGNTEEETLHQFKEAEKFHLALRC